MEKPIISNVTEYLVYENVLKHRFKCLDSMYTKKTYQDFLELINRRTSTIFIQPPYLYDGDIRYSDFTILDKKRNIFIRIEVKFSDDESKRNDFIAASGQECCLVAHHMPEKELIMAYFGKGATKHSHEIINIRKVVSRNMDGHKVRFLFGLKELDEYIGGLFLGL